MSDIEQWKKEIRQFQRSGQTAIPFGAVEAHRLFSLLHRLTQAEAERDALKKRVRELEESTSAALDLLDGHVGYGPINQAVQILQQALEPKDGSVG